MGAIQTAAPRWLTEAGEVLFLAAVFTAHAFPQVIIRDTIRILPQLPRPAPGAAAQGGAILRLVLLQTGNVDLRPSASHILWMTNPCGDENSADINGSVAEVAIPARGGVTAAMNSFRVLQSPSLERIYKFYLDDDLIDSMGVESNCPVACLFQGQIGVIPLYSSFQLGIDQQFGETSMQYGKASGNFDLQYAIENCSGTVWSPGSKTTISIVEGAAVGTLINAAGEDVGDEFTGTADQIRQLRFLANGFARGGINAVVLRMSSRGITSTHTIDVFNPAPAVHHFEVIVSPDTIHYGETAAVFVRAKDVQSQTVELSDASLLQFYVGVEQAGYGTLGAVIDGQERTGAVLSDVPYGTARVGGVVFVAGGMNPIMKGPQTVPIGVQWVEDAGVQGLGNVVVECKLGPPRYAQGDPKWGREWYDSAFASDEAGNVVDTARIKDLGCALSCMAMAMTAFGDTIDPGALNDYNKNPTSPENARFRGSSVKWKAMTEHSRNEIYCTEPEDTDSTFDLEVLRNPVKECRLVIAKVFNPESVKKKSKEYQEMKRKEGNHWVLIKGIKGGDYQILDPGRGLTLLSEYGKVYRYLEVFSGKGE